MKIKNCIEFQFQEIETFFSVLSFKMFEEREEEKFKRVQEKFQLLVSMSRR